MVALAEWIESEQTPSDAENRVGDFFGSDADLVGETALQVVEGDWEKQSRAYDSRRGYVLPQKENEWDKKKCQELLAQTNKDYAQQSDYRTRHRVLARKLPGVDKALVGKTFVSAIANVGSSMGALTPENIVSVGQMASKGSKSGAMARNLAAHVARNLRGPGVPASKIAGPLDIAGAVINHGIDLYHGQFSATGAAYDAAKLASTRIYGFGPTLVATGLPDMLRGSHVSHDTNIFMNHEDGFEALAMDRILGGKVDTALEILNGPCKDFLD